MCYDVEFHPRHYDFVRRCHRHYQYSIILQRTKVA